MRNKIQILLHASSTAPENFQSMAEKFTGGSSVAENLGWRTVRHIPTLGRQLVNIPLSPARTGIATFRKVASTGSDVLLVSRNVTGRIIADAAHHIFSPHAELQYATDFDEKFANREKLLVGTRKVEILDLQPEEGNHRSPQPVVALPGFFESIEDAEFVIRELHNEGYRVLSFDPESYSLETHTQIASALINKATEVSGHPKVSLFLTSMGGMYGAEAARRDPDKIGLIVNFETAGIMGMQSHLGIAARTALGGIKDAAAAIRVGEPQGDEMIDGLMYVLKTVIRDPKAALGLIDDLAKQRINALDIMQALKRDYGIPIGLITPGGDETFDINKVQQAISKRYAEIREQIAKDRDHHQGPFLDVPAEDIKALFAKLYGSPTLIFDGIWTLRDDLDHFSITAKPWPLVKLFPHAIRQLEAKQHAINDFELEKVG